MLTGPTAGLAADYAQGNLVIVAGTLAGDFARFCRLNPGPCPLLAETMPGDPRVPSLGADIDVRTDVPKYRVIVDGEVVTEPTDIVDLWRDDFVAFVLGCSFTFESALVGAGIRLRHLEMRRNVSMYRTSIQCRASGPFEGPLVVSMRPIKTEDVARAIEITSHYPDAHGAPVHVGRPAAIGIRDLSSPDYGDAVDVEPGETPVFWACGVTPQAVIAAARIPFAITHAPGCMLVTDLPARVTFRT
jgi:uncharacterized protein YcsI (UPF0317 family)